MLLTLSRKEGGAPISPPRLPRLPTNSAAVDDPRWGPPCEEPWPRDRTSARRSRLWLDTVWAMNWTWHSCAFEMCLMPFVLRASFGVVVVRPIPSTYTFTRFNKIDTHMKKITKISCLLRRFRLKKVWGWSRSVFSLRLGKRLKRCIYIFVDGALREGATLLWEISRNFVRFPSSTVLFRRKGVKLEAIR